MTVYDIKEEKMRMIEPILENSLISSILLTEEEEFNWKVYQKLFGIREQYGYIVVIEYGDKGQGRKPANPIGAGVELQRYQKVFRQIIQSYFPGIIGGPMLNRMFVCVPVPRAVMMEEEWEEVRECARRMAEEVERRSKLNVKVGIGNIKAMKLIQLSCRQALTALKQMDEKVAQIGDVCGSCKYEEDYPLEIEEKMFLAVKRGNVKEVEVQSRKFFDWMMEKEGQLSDNIRLKCLEFVLRGETIGYFQGGMTYYFDCREGYLKEVLSCKCPEEMEAWFLNRMEEAGINMGAEAGEHAGAEQNFVKEAQEYVKQNYQQEIPMNKMAEMFHIHPNYFSRIFKEKTGISYIDFVSQVKVEKAEKMLQKGEKSIKEISVECGYADPNYFSRIFKKKTGMSPGEYRKRQLRTIYPDSETG